MLLALIVLGWLACGVVNYFAVKTFSQREFGTWDDSNKIVARLGIFGGPLATFMLAINGCFKHGIGFRMTWKRFSMVWGALAAWNFGCFVWTWGIVGRWMGLVNGLAFLVCCTLVAHSLRRHRDEHRRTGQGVGVPAAAGAVHPAPPALLNTAKAIALKYAQRPAFGPGAFAPGQIIPWQQLSGVTAMTQFVAYGLYRPIPLPREKSELVYGWRWWYIVGGKLRSIHQDYVWEPGGVAHARDIRTVPDSGFYAFKHLEDARQYWYDLTSGSQKTNWPIVTGRLAMRGTVIEHERGYRAEYAYPESLMAFEEDHTLAGEVAEQYGVPLVLMPKEIAKELLPTADWAGMTQTIAFGPSLPCPPPPRMVWPAQQLGDPSQIAWVPRLGHHTRLMRDPLGHDVLQISDDGGATWRDVP